MASFLPAGLQTDATWSAITLDSLKLMLFDFTTQKWTELVNAKVSSAIRIGPETGAICIFTGFSIRKKATSACKSATANLSVS